MYQKRQRGSRADDRNPHACERSAEGHFLCSSYKGFSRRWKIREASLGLKPLGITGLDGFLRKKS